VICDHFAYSTVTISATVASVVRSVCFRHSRKTIRLVTFDSQQMSNARSRLIDAQISLRPTAFTS
jgi:hypothetical protein